MDLLKRAMAAEHRFLRQRGSVSLQEAIRSLELARDRGCDDGALSNALAMIGRASGDLMAAEALGRLLESFEKEETK